jgi:hypothetical protein
MLFAIVLTSNHWILDGIAAIPTVLIAGGLAFGLRWLWDRRPERVLDLTRTSSANS